MKLLWKIFDMDGGIMTLLLIGIFVWIWLCMQVCDWIYDKTLSFSTSSLVTTVLFLLPVTLFFDLVRIMQ